MAKIKVLHDKLFLVSLNINSWDGWKFDKKASSKVNDDFHANASASRVNKRLFPQEAIKPLIKVRNCARTFNYDQTSPFTDGLNGWRICGAGNVWNIVNNFRVYQESFFNERDEFIGRYLEFIKTAHSYLGDLFDSADYPETDPEILKARFGFSWRTMALPDPAEIANRKDLRNCLAENADEIISGMVADASAIAESAAHSLRHDSLRQIAETVAHMADRLDSYEVVPGKDGKDKTEKPFRDSLVSNIAELAEIVTANNAMNDPVLNKLADKMKKVLCKYEPETLRLNIEAREKTAEAAKKIIADSPELSAFFK